MIQAQTVWRVNIPEVLGLFDAGLDDLCVDGDGRVYIGDGANGAVYRFHASGDTDTAFDVIHPTSLGGDECGLNLAVAADSSFYVADPGGELVVRYDALGQTMGEFAVPGLLAQCSASQGGVYVLASDGDRVRIELYDLIGSRVEALCAPKRHRAHLDPELATIDCDSSGRAYVSYGMPPYRVWRVTRAESAEDESEGQCLRADLETWSRSVDHPEDAVLVSDLALDPARSILWVLLASREAGRQTLDAFSLSGDFLGSAALPHSDNLYTGVCAGAEGVLYLVDGAASDLLRISVAMP
jgi:sugar lactone lactonase YvrE